MWNSRVKFPAFRTLSLPERTQHKHCAGHDYGKAIRPLGERRTGLRVAEIVRLSHILCWSEWCTCINVIIRKTLRRIKNFFRIG